MKCLSCLHSWKRTKFSEYVFLFPSCPNCGSRLFVRNDFILSIANVLKNGISSRIDYQDKVDMENEISNIRSKELNIGDWNNNKELKNLLIQNDKLILIKLKKEKHQRETSNDYPRKIRDKEKEIEHYGDTVDKTDHQYTFNIDEIMRMKKEIKTVKTELKNLDNDIFQKRQEILNYKREIS